MKIKKVCEITGLTERTVRFYVEQGLVRPASYESNDRTYYEYGDADIRKIEQIAVLRKMGFSIAAILEMDAAPQKIDGILRLHAAALREDAQALSAQLDALEKARGKHFTDLGTLCEALRGASPTLPLPRADVQPDFGRFDPETKEEKRSAYLDFLAHQRLNEQLTRFFRPFGVALLVCLAAGLLLLAAYGVSCIPKAVRQEYAGVKYRAGQAEVLDTVQIQVEGRLYRRLFREPVFKGVIRLSGVPDSCAYDVEVLFPSGMEEAAVLTYAGVRTGPGGSRPYINTYAMLRTDLDFNFLILQVFEPEGGDQKSTGDLVIIAPAQTVGEAEKIVAAQGLENTYPFGGAGQ